MGDHEDQQPAIPIVVGIAVGLLASFVQSLGLTIQRKSHVQNDLLPLEEQKRTYKRPLWLFGFAVFISSNLFGTVFQIGALPIVILAPLGAISLLWNAVLSRILLRERFSARALGGTALIAIGASQIAIWGVVPEQNHTLEELLSLFRRDGFVIYISLTSAAVAAVLLVSHLVEWRLHAQETRQGQIALPENVIASPEPSDYGSISHRGANSIPFTTTNYADQSPQLAQVASHLSTPTPTQSAPTTPRSAMRQPRNTVDSDDALVPRPRKSVHYKDPSRSSEQRPLVLLPESDHMLEELKTNKTRTLLGLSFAACSGTLSGMSLLFAKCAVELLILTFASKGKDNQFKTVESWILLIGLGIIALAQLFYLNHSLRFAGPTLICPLAFCFYTVSSIFDGLVFYSQVGQLAAYQIALVTLGIALLFLGVWSVSAIEPVTGQGGVQVGSWADEAESDSDEEDSEPNPFAWTETLTAASPEPERSNVGSNTLAQSSSAVMADRDLDFTPPVSPMSSSFTHHRRRRSSAYQARYGTLLPDYAPPGVPAGFSIGFNTSSPGFALRTSHHHRRRSSDHTISDFSSGGEQPDQSNPWVPKRTSSIRSESSYKDGGAARSQSPHLPPPVSVDRRSSEGSDTPTLRSSAHPSIMDRVFGLFGSNSSSSNSNGERGISLPSSDDRS